jgi:hypothetical protein
MQGSTGNSRALCLALVAVALSAMIGAGVARAADAPATPANSAGSLDLVVSQFETEAEGDWHAASAIPAALDRELRWLPE